MTNLPLWKQQLIDTGTFTPAGINVIVDFEGTKDEWIDQYKFWCMLCYHHLPKDWVDYEIVRQAALGRPDLAMDVIAHNMPTDLLEKCVELCDPDLEWSIAKGKAELERRKEQEFLVKTIQTI